MISVSSLFVSCVVLVHYDDVRFMESTEQHGTDASMQLGSIVCLMNKKIQFVSVADALLMLTGIELMIR